MAGRMGLLIRLDLARDMGFQKQRPFRRFGAAAISSPEARYARGAGLGLRLPAIGGGCFGPAEHGERLDPKSDRKRSQTMDLYLLWIVRIGLFYWPTTPPYLSGGSWRRNAGSF